MQPAAQLSAAPTEALPEQLARLIEQYLADSPQACVAEDGVMLFDLANDHYSLSTNHGKCVLHLWSRGRNAVRRVLSAEETSGCMRLSVQRFGQTKPGRIEIWRDRDRRTPTAKRIARTNFQLRLRALLEQRFAGWTIDRLTCDMDLERSFGPVYSRGLIRRGRGALAVFGVNSQESQPSIDAALTFAILWLDHCRKLEAPRRIVEGLCLFVPSGKSAVLRERLAHLVAAGAKWQLFEFSEDVGSVCELDTADSGNIETRLMASPDHTSALERFSVSRKRVREIVPEADVVVCSGGEVAFRLHGLEFARARIEYEPGPFRAVEQIVFGAGARETVLTADNLDEFASMMTEARAVRVAEGDRNHPLWRMAPERWLESLIARDPALLDPRIDPTYVYPQVPAFAARDRGIIDVLTSTQDGRLAVIELKANEDIHLPLQGIDYWSRVVWHQQRGEFARFGYFAGKQLSERKPILLLVAPALRVHPATDTLLRYLSPAIDYELIGIDERWREQVRVVFRKRAPKQGAGS
jgi:hypothetical protein